MQVSAVCSTRYYSMLPLQWCHNERDSVSNHQPHDCLLKTFIQAQIKDKTSKLRVTGLGAGNLPGTGEFPAQMKWPVTRKMFPFDDVIMTLQLLLPDHKIKSSTELYIYIYMYIYVYIYDIYKASTPILFHYIQ